MTRFPFATIAQIALGFAAAVFAVHLLDYDPTDELPAAATAAEPRTSMRALSPKRTAGEKRVFFVGASMTRGYPYKAEACFARQMHAGLQAVLPGGDKTLVHEYAKPALDSRELAQLVDRVLERYDPSLICVCLGSNEFANRIFSGEELVPPTAIGRFGEHASRARLLFRALPKSRASDEERMQAKLRDRLDDARAFRPLFKALPVGARDAALLARRLRRMMRRMSAACAARKVPLVFVVAVYGLGGFWPWGTSGPANAEIDALVRMTWNGVDAQRARAMRAQVEALVAAHPARADVQFLHGVVLRALGERAAARDAFVRARDLDTVPMHQTGGVRRAIVETARSLDRACLALDDAFVADGDVLPDVRQYLDYGHLTIDGNRRAGLWLAGQLMRLGHLPDPGGDWTLGFEKAARAHVDASVSATDRALGRPGIAASNVNFSMMFGNFRDAIPWLGISVPEYLRHEDTRENNEQRVRLAQCVFDLNGRYDDVMALPNEERFALLSKLDGEMIRASIEGQLLQWIAGKLDAKD